MKKIKITHIVICLLYSYPLYAQSYNPPAQLDWHNVPLTDAHWDFQRSFESITVEDSQAIKMRGLAISRFALDKNFALEMVARDSHWGCLMFHVHDVNTFEHVYFRTPSSGNGEALQYSPTVRGINPWRLYESEQAAAVYNPGWNTFRIDVINGSAYVFVNNGPQPVHIVPKLRLPKSGQRIGFGALFGTVTVKQLRYAKIVSDAVMSPLPGEKGLIESWQISQAFNLLDADNDFSKALMNYSYPRQPRIDSIHWTPVQSEYDGVLNLMNYHPPTNEQGWAHCVYAKTNVSTPTAVTKKLAFGYCDLATVFLNGKLIYSGFQPLRDQKHYFRMKQVEAIDLPLEAGDNELLVITSGDAVSGWGILGKIIEN